MTGNGEFNYKRKDFEKKIELLYYRNGNKKRNKIQFNHFLCLKSTMVDFVYKIFHRNGQKYFLLYYFET